MAQIKLLVYTNISKFGFSDCNCSIDLKTFKPILNDTVVDKTQYKIVIVLTQTKPLSKKVLTIFFYNICSS